MIQEILTGIIVGVCLAAAATALVRRLRGGRPSCGCDKVDCGGCPKKRP